jgi:NitT/TauT family transport system substrate-binding protein
MGLSGRTLLLASLVFLAGHFFVLPIKAEPLEPVRLRLDWFAGANHAAIFLAAARRYYAEAGINLEVLDGKGSVATIQAIDSGNDLIGVASLTTTTIAVAKGMSLVAIGGIVQKSPDAIIALKGSGILTPKDVEGKRWGVVPDASFARSFPAFAAAQSIDIKSITRIQLSSSTLYSALLQGNVDFITGWASNDALKISRQKPIEPPIVFANYGVNILGTGFIVTRATVERRADLLRRFMAATAKGARDAEADPAAAVEAVVKARPSIDRSIVTAELIALAEFQHTERTKDRPFGWMAKEDWIQTHELLTKFFDLSGPVDIDRLYTNEFIPN